MTKLEKIQQWEKLAEKLVNKIVPKFSDNFDSVKINVVPNTMYDDYYVHCDFIMKKPFNKYESDFLHNFRDEIKGYVKNFLPPLDKKYSMSFGTTAREVYDTKSKPYYDRKKESLDEQVIKTLKVISSL